MRLSAHFLGSVAACALLVGHTAIAQETETASASQSAAAGTGEVYEPDYFDRFSPKTARDMLDQIPGFSLRRGNGDRGLGQGGTNVIINGARVSGKQTDPVDVLERTPASNVVRIEIVDAASLSIPGLSGQVANFIIDNSQVSGSWEWNPRFRTGLKPDLYNGKISVSGEKDILSYTFSFDNTNAFKGGGKGPEFVFDNDGDLIETRSEDGKFYGENPTVSTNLTWNRENGDVGNLNAQFALFEFDGQEESLRIPTDTSQQPRLRFFQEAEDEWNAEVSGDYRFDFWDGQLKLIGLQYYESSPFVTSVVTTQPGSQPSGSRFQRQADEGETIGRVEYSWQPAEGKSWEVAAEGVYNFLEIDDFVEVLNNQGDFETLPSTVNNSRVEENRYEATLSHSRPWGEKVDIQASIGIEYSEISQESQFQRFVTDPDTNMDVLTPFMTSQKRSFTRPKGFISAAYEKSDSMDIRVKLERRVGQLNFFDFIGSVNLSSGIDQSGNPDLVPPQTWRTEVEFEKRYENDSKITLQLFLRQIEDIVDTVPLELPGADLSNPNRQRGEGPGNLESAQAYGFEVNSTFKLDNIGIEGGELDFEFFWQDTKVDDPLTGEERPLSGNTEWFSGVRYRHDIPETDYAYGFFADYFENSPQFGLRQISQFQWSDPFIGVFVEDKDFYGMNFRVSLNNLANGGEIFDRTFFSDFRDAPGAMQIRERREFRFDQIVRFSLSGTF